jgi:predicted RNase H-like HicB family nuclease
MQRSKPPKSGAPSEPSPESLAKIAKSGTEAEAELKRALETIKETGSVTAQAGRKIERELVRRRSVPTMTKIIPPPIQIPRPTKKD